MGANFSYPSVDDSEDVVETPFHRSLSFGRENVGKAFRSHSFNGQDSRPSAVKSFGSRKMLLQGSLSSNGREVECRISIQGPSLGNNLCAESISHTVMGTDGKQSSSDSAEKSSMPLVFDSGDGRYQAVLKLQKVYRGLRTRRQLIQTVWSLKRREQETKISANVPSRGYEKNAYDASMNYKIRETDDQPQKSDSNPDKLSLPSISDSGDSERQAALKLQKVYRGLSTRRQIIQALWSSKGRELEITISTKSTLPDNEGSSKSDSIPDKSSLPLVLDSGDGGGQAALKLQKVYRGLRTRRQIIQTLWSSKGRDPGTTISAIVPSSDNENSTCTTSVTNKLRETDGQPSKLCRTGVVSDSRDQRYQAALRLQKVYKSFRTRRQLADGAVIVEQKWWKILDLAALKHSSISFFDIEKPETAISRWSRARTRAATVGKGLSKDDKARKLALQHWLEAIDPRHRYGHNLQYYYVKWLHCQSRQPFFYWLDVGDGREINLVDRCPRSKLLQQCIKYLGPKEREDYEVILENGRFKYKQSRRVLDTRPKGSKWIFVLSTSKILYVGQKNKGTFQHSSFLAGGATLSAGRLIVEDGIIKAVWPHSGHYLPTEENFQAFMSFLKEHDVDLTHVKKSPTEEDEEKGNIWRKLFAACRAKEAAPGNTQGIEHDNLAEEGTDSREQDSSATEDTNTSKSRFSHGLRLKLSKLEIPNREEIIEMFNIEQQADDSSSDGYETAEDSVLSEYDFIFPKLNIFSEDEEEEFQDPIPQETILHRINTHRRTRSYQLGEQLSCKWTTGAGPRIGCLRDYPSRLQFQALEQVNLSPRCTPASSPRALLPSHLRKETRRSPLGAGSIVKSPEPAAE
ncbi:hypothetical protein Ancab_030885 [Ancistrocladus abbreviatus]